MDGWIEIGTRIDTKTFEKQIRQLEDKLEGLEEEYKIAVASGDFPEEALKEYEVEIEKTQNKLAGLKKQQEGLNQATMEYDNTFGKSLKKIGKLALGIFSVRSAYMLIRQTANQLANENDDIAQKISAIRGSLTNLLAPAITWIVDMVYKLLGYLNVITKTFFGIDLFAKSSKSAKSTSKSVDKIKKQLAGFDEMNVLNNDKSSGGGGGSGSGKIPEPEVSGEWQKTIEDYKKMWDEILEIDEYEATEMLKQSDRFWGEWKAGIFRTTQGVVKIIDGIVHGDLKQIGEGALELITGLAEQIIGIFKGIISFVMFLGEDVGKTIRSMIDKVVEFVKNAFNKVKEFGSQAGTKIKEIFTKAVDKVKEVFSGLKTHAKNIFEGIKSVLKAPINTIIGWINKLISGLNKVSIDIPAWINKLATGENKDRKFGFNIKTIPTLAQGGIVNNPGRGVFMGSYIAGEKGQEAVIPLTDDTLQRLANMIPITINLTNQMNGRVISRELQKINNESNFAMNR